MNKDTQLVIQKLAESFLNAFKAALKSDIGINNKTGHNSLENSSLSNDAQSRFIDKDGDAVVELLVNDYVQFIESGRRIGAKFPPVAPIVKWCRKNGIPTDNSTVYLIRRAISRNGIMARPIMQYVWEDIDSQIESIYFDKIFENIIKEITNYFNG